MRKEFNHIQKINYRITLIEKEIEATRTSTFYNEFSNEGDRFKDLTVLRAALRDAINQKTEAIDKLMHACEIEKQEMNNQFVQISVWQPKKEE